MEKLSKIKLKGLLALFLILDVNPNQNISCNKSNALSITWAR